MAVQGLKNFVDNTAAAADLVGKTASKLGISVEQLQSFRFAAEQSGVAANTFDMALQRFIRRSAEAAKGMGEAKDALKELEVSATDSVDNLRDPLVMLKEVADKMATIPNQGDKVRLAMKLFDTEGVALVNMLQGGSAEMAKLRQEAHDLGFVLNKPATDAAANYGDAMNRLHKAQKGVSDVLALKLMPAFTAMANYCARLSASMHLLVTDTSTLRVAFLFLTGVVIALGVKIWIAFAPLMATFGVMASTVAAIGAGILLLALLIEDVWVAFQGGESVLGNLHKKARAFFEPIEQWFLKLPAVVWHALTKAFDVSVTSITKQLLQLEKWVVGVIDSLQTQVTQFFDNLRPDFLTKGFSGTLKLLGLHSSESPEKTAPRSFMPQEISRLNHINHSQNMSVEVNVQSPASPHEIGSEVSKAVRKELERERHNAYMGVMNYAS